MDYEQFKIRRFDFWDLYLHENQFPYIGRCYASAIREDADLVTDMTLQESQDLFSIVVPSWHEVVSNLYGESRPNVAILGNEWAHLHAHLIPRFQDTKRFYEIDFADPNPTGNYAPYQKKEISLDVLLRIKEDIRIQYGT
jgi:diadenosine tetraphosphate (Ap4A) HIT family hydrolase|tara:strand:- start:95 stop:514 length:420 start_codon:yes stop_codon:yes gene_type:complete